MYYSVHSRYIRQISHKAVFWNIPTDKNELFLTFDDGPVPGTTEFILEQLERFNAKATFFCVGDNIRKYPHLFEEIIKQGHSVGNHTFHHINGWKHSLRSYVNNVNMCASLTKSKLFRPPYGRLTPLQRYVLQKKYFILMWSVLPGDFDPELSGEKCLERVIKHSHGPGSVIVFHDNYKAESKLRYTLPKYLEYCSEQNFIMSPITEDLCRHHLTIRRKRLVHQISFGMI
jgi:peptidoglycan-N-acetylglucosamine deacetylase